MKFFFLILFFLAFFLNPAFIFAKSNSFVTVVNPVRGGDFWDLQNQKIEDTVVGQLDILKGFNVPATYLIRYDAFKSSNIINLLKNTDDEKGIFLEITPAWTKDANIPYRQSDNWHNAGSAFLSGYEADERVKLIDSAFKKFKEIFGAYPKSVGAWWIDSYSLEYMQEKYGIIGALIVGDQYTTDNYQIWGQYFSTPYYPSRKNILHPAQTLDSKLPVVITQWAPRDPLNAYGDGVQESTFSVQANDYSDYHNLSTDYFSFLVDVYTKQILNSFGQIVIGLENSYDWKKYSQEYRKQIEVLSEKQEKGELNIVKMEEFSSWYGRTFSNLSPEHVIVADDPLGSSKKVVWFMNPYYRVGWFFTPEGSLFRDVRQYVDGAEEPCYIKSCSSVNFATFATRVLDNVTYGHKLVIDEGKISDFNIKRSGENIVLSYKNEAGHVRYVEFLTRDVGIDGKISSIDNLILEATKNSQKKQQVSLPQGPFKWSVFDVLTKIIKFSLFLIIGCLVPGLILIKKVLPSGILQKSAISLVSGFVLSTGVFYLLGLLNLKQGIYVYFLINLFLGFKIRKSIFELLNLRIKDKFTLVIPFLIGIGTIFQQLPAFKNGLNFPYGFGFWGPNTHDGIWHVSLINQLIKNVPPENPIYSGDILKNYHYFYDLLVALTHNVSGIPVLDLLFRFYPITFSILLGVLTFYLIKLFNPTKLGILLGLYLVYFAGSFGWIVEYIKVRHLGGESAFWANQSVSFNLNPPFAISLLIVITIFLLLFLQKNSKAVLFILTILAGTLISFKAYGAILILLTLLIVGILKKNLNYLILFATGSILSMAMLLSNFTLGQKLIIFSPFWFIHSMVDSPDRVGWARLSLARVAGFETKNYFKLISAEAISFLIFVIGNLGTRVFALFSILKIKKIFADINYLTLLIFSILSLFIPILFIQAGNPWNTIQFMYYFLYISAVVGGIVFAKVVAKLPKVLFMPAVLIFIFVTPINAWATANGYITYNPHAYINPQEIEALDFLRSKEQGIVLTYPYDPKLKDEIVEPWPIYVYDSTAYVSAVSGKVVFVEDEPQNQILLNDYKKRIILSKDFFLSGKKTFLTENNISYIYLPKIHHISLEEKDLSKIFENDYVYIYEVN